LVERIAYALHTECADFTPVPFSPTDLLDRFGRGRFSYTSILEELASHGGSLRLFSTPVEGTHYLTDMIAGALVAMAALWIVAATGRRLARTGRAGERSGDASFPGSLQDRASVPAE